MIKVIILDKRKPGMSPEAFRKHYEEVHAPLFLSLVPKIHTYTRNYVTPITGADDVDGWSFAKADYDCIVEMKYETQEDFDNTMAFLMSHEARALAEDEENFIDRKSMVLYAADECSSIVD